MSVAAWEQVDKLLLDSLWLWRLYTYDSLYQSLTEICAVIVNVFSASVVFFLSR